MFKITKKSAGWNAAPLYKAGGAAAYAGPGDIDTYVMWWGLRGYSAAHSVSSNPCIDVVDQAGANSTTIYLTTSGSIDLAALNTWVSSHSVTTIKVATLYEQATGSTAFAQVQGTLAAMPVLTQNVLGGGTLPVLTFSSSSTQLLNTTGTSSQALPLTVSAIAKRTGATTGLGLIGVGGNTAVCSIFFSNSSDTVALFAGGLSAGVTAAENTFHALQGVFDATGTAGTLMVDGSTSGNLSPGNTPLSGNSFGINSGGFPWDGQFCEVGFTGSAMSSANQAATNSQQHSYWGF